MTTSQHEYISTACLHGLCGSCRNTCKYCGTSCQHDCHPATGTEQVSPVDQARGIARELLEAARPGALLGIGPGLWRRIQADPDLFWLRGEEVPPGTWEAP